MTYSKILFMFSLFVSTLLSAKANLLDELLASNADGDSDDLEDHVEIMINSQALNLVDEVIVGMQAVDGMWTKFETALVNGMNDENANLENTGSVTNEEIASILELADSTFSTFRYRPSAFRDRLTFDVQQRLGINPIPLARTEDGSYLVEAPLRSVTLLELKKFALEELKSTLETLLRLVDRVCPDLEEILSFDLPFIAPFAVGCAPIIWGLEGVIFTVGRLIALVKFRLYVDNKYNHFVDFQYNFATYLNVHLLVSLLYAQV